MLWLKALHLIFVVTWFAGLFYLPRLFIYHALCDDAPGIARFKVMERKLLNVIMTPSALLAIGFGAIMIGADWHYYGHARWLGAKLVFVAGVVAYHAYCAYIVRSLANDNSPHGATFYRVFNELPALALICIVILAVVKPF